MATTNHDRVGKALELLHQSATRPTVVSFRRTASASWSTSLPCQWGHRFPTHYFALHYSPALYAFFAVARLLPHLATLKSLSNILRLRTLALLAENRPAEALDEQASW
jgi:hypothetical protein